MSLLVRKESRPRFDHHQDYRPFLRRDFCCRCAYCERTEAFLGGEESFEIDHFKPVHTFESAGQATYYENLYYSCAKCNRYKGGVWPSPRMVAQGLRFADPCREDMYQEHIRETPDGTLNVLTSCGRYTCQHIRLDRPSLMAWRRMKLEKAEERRQLEQLKSMLELELSNPEQMRPNVAALNAVISDIKRRFAI